MNETVLVLKFSSLSGGDKHANYNTMVLRTVVDPSSTKKDVITWLGDGEGMSAFFVSVHFTLTTYFNSDYPHFKHSIVAHG